MAPGWFAPPGSHAMRPQQSQQPGSGRFHPGHGPPGHSQRIPHAGTAAMNGGVNSPHTHTYHQRISPPLRGPYHNAPRPHGPPPPPGVVGHAHAPPHGARMQGSGRYQMQHPHAPQAMVVGAPRSLPPPNSHAHAHAGPVPAGHSHNHAHMSQHHTPRRMQIPPPNAMRPIPQQARPAFDKQRPGALQQHPQHGMPRGMPQHQHMMQVQEHHQQQQQRQGFHQLQSHQSSSSIQHQGGENAAASHQIQRQTSAGGDSLSENGGQQQHQQMLQPQPAAAVAPGTPEQRPASHHSHGTLSRSPSPPPIPPNFQQQQDQSTEASSQASLPDNEASGGEHTSGDRFAQYHHHHHHHPPPFAKAPSWHPGPLRESRLQNMPQKRMMVPMQHHPHHHPHHQYHHPHAQRPIPHPNPTAYINENFRAMELKAGGPPHHHHGMKPIHYPPPQHPQPPILHPSMRALHASPGPHHHHVLPPQPLQEAQKQGAKKGPDITMDAASMLLALRTSASPSTVSAATLEEQASKDHSEVSKKTNSADQQDHDDLEDDDVPALASSSSSLSAPPKPAVQHHEVPKNFPTRLALPNDEAKLNSLHCFLRSELLEIFVVERSANKSPTHSPGSSVGRVGLRCVFCAMVRKRHALSTTAEHDASGCQQPPRCDEAPMAVFYPKSIAEIYRLVTSWQRCHLRKCRNLPPDIRSKWTLLRENDKSRGKTHYWITSAKEIGLVDCNSRAGGIRFATPRSNSAASGSIATLADNDSIVSVSEGMSYNQGHEHEGLHNHAHVYQPHNNPNFTEGPSQKHREAVSRDVAASSSSAALSMVESPLKRENEEDQTKAAPMEVNADTGESEQAVKTDNVPALEASASAGNAAVTSVSSTDQVVPAASSNDKIIPEASSNENVVPGGTVGAPPPASSNDNVPPAALASTTAPEHPPAASDDASALANGANLTAVGV